MQGTWPERETLLKVQKEHKVRFQTKIEQKPNIPQR